MLALPPPPPVLPVPIAVWSAGAEVTNPETQNASIALAPVEAEKLTVITSPLVRPVVTGAENKRVLTVVPFTATPSCV